MTRNRSTERGTVKARLANIFLIAIFSVVFQFPVAEADAKERPEITRHEVRLLERAARVTVQWQSPNPVLRVLVIVGREQKEKVGS